MICKTELEMGWGQGKSSEDFLGRLFLYGLSILVSISYILIVKSDKPNSFDPFSRAIIGLFVFLIKKFYINFCKC